ncbi:hypothetical protein AGMMS50239_25430 [Bacteroidia bacterium]|nr:hypothetical protein AGMMS50239_25430 [Bacteroidia bacterium]
MYKFRILEAYYDVDVTLTYPDYTSNSYHCREHLIVRYRQDENLFLFEMCDRSNILINGKEPEEIMDRLMMELGNVLYPMILQTSPSGEILRVQSFDEIQTRWLTKARELLKANKTYPFGKYMQISTRNLKDEALFIKALLKNSFYKCYFLPAHVESFLFEVCHFPQRSANTLFLFEANNSDSIIESNDQSFSAKMIFPAEKEASGILNRSFTELGDLYSLKSELNWANTEGEDYKKTMVIQTDMEKRDILKANKFWSFILD